MCSMGDHECKRLNRLFLVLLPLVNLRVLKKLILIISASIVIAFFYRGSEFEHLYSAVPAVPQCVHVLTDYCFYFYGLEF